MKNAVKVISRDENTVTVGGYGVVFGGKDLVQETFTAETDFMLDLVPIKLVMYDHAMQATVKHQLGSVPNSAIKYDDVGLWIEAQLDLSRAYVREVVRLAEMGVLGWSSGSVGHLAEVESGIIKRWPLIEFSLTPTPAEPRTLGAEVLKHLAELHPELKALVPEGPGDGPANDATGGGDRKRIIQLKARAVLALDN